MEAGDKGKHKWGEADIGEHGGPMVDPDHESDNNFDDEFSVNNTNNNFGGPRRKMSAIMPKIGNIGVSREDWVRQWRRLKDVRKLRTWQTRRHRTKPYVIKINDFEANKREHYPSNFISTAKYTWWNFIFKVLFDQFTKVANVYFLTIIIIQFIPGLTPILPITSIIPLAFVIIVAAIKEAIEDFFRHKEDRLNNNKKYKVIRDYNDGLRSVKSQDLRPGDIVAVKDGSQIPADMVVLSSSAEEGSCYITTANLDGETNLKLRKAVAATAGMGLDVQQLRSFKGSVKCEPPNEHLYHFLGTYTPYTKHGENLYAPAGADEGGKQKKIKHPLDEDHLLLRGSQLRNTDCIFGLIVYAGRDTKMSLNLRQPPTKHSTIDKTLNKLVLLLFCVLLLIVVFCAVSSGLWQGQYGEKSWYIDEDQNLLVYMLSNFGTYLILLSNFVPISLWVTHELVKAGQAKFMEWDMYMRSPNGKHSMKAKTSNLNEDLGRVQHIFTDKTGTLTENLMKFAKSSVDGTIYEEDMDELLAIQERKEKRAKKALRQEREEKQARGGYSSDEDGRMESAPGDEISDDSDSDSDDNDLSDNESDDERLGAMGSELRQLSPEEQLEHPLMQYMRVCSLCHGVVPEISKKTGRILYRTPSPDEKALVDVALVNGCVFIARSAETLTVREFGREKTYDLLATLGFTPERRRMSVIVREPETGKLWLLIKGADDVIMRRASSETPPALVAANNQHLRQFASEGLRTLVLAMRELEESEYFRFKESYDDAMITIDKMDRSRKLQEAYAMVEHDLSLVGSSAIEDKLQDKVPETIKYLIEAGINIWVVTGDKQETAIEIGRSTLMLTDDMDVIILNAWNDEQARGLLSYYIDAYDLKSGAPLEPTWDFWNWKWKHVARFFYGYEKRILRVEDEEPDIGINPIQMEYVPESGVHEVEKNSLRDSEAERQRRRVEEKRRREEITAERKRMPRGLVVDGETLKYVLKEENVRDFVLLARSCRSVICCRTSPLQKALIVRSIKKGERKICLAIGDGANDVSMLQKAHVGVGIFGKEGTQAARASDYALHEFKHLKRLLCVHGRYSQIRSAGLIQYSFYKNIAYNLALFWFSFYSAFSGQVLFDSWILGSFNVFFTSLPPLIYGLFERDIDDKLINTHPRTYRKVQSGSVLTFWTFSRWMASAVWHSLVAFFAVWFLFRNDILSKNGWTMDMWGMGLFTGTYLVIIVLNKIMLEHEEWNAVVITSYAASLTFLWLFLICYAGFDIDPWFITMYYVFYRVLGTVGFWALLFWVPIVAFLPDVIYQYVNRQYFPEDWQILKEMTETGFVRSSASTSDFELAELGKPTYSVDSSSFDMEEAYAEPVGTSRSVRDNPLTVNSDGEESSYRASAFNSDDAVPIPRRS